MTKMFAKRSDGKYDLVDTSDIVPGTFKYLYEDGRIVGMQFLSKKRLFEELAKFNSMSIPNKEKGFTYLIKQGKFYKIGYTVDLKSRILSYETHNIDFKVIGYLNGNCEKELQKMFKEYHYKKEWFHKNKEILNEFKKRGMIKYEAINNFENGK